MELLFESAGEFVGEVLVFGAARAWKFTFERAIPRLTVYERLAPTWSL